MSGQNSIASGISRRRLRLAAGLAATPMAIIAVSAALLNPAMQLERGLAEAIAVETRLIASAERPGQQRTIAQSGVGYEEGSEGFWLTRAPDAESVSLVNWSAPVSTGDRLVMNFGAYDREIVEVISVAEARTLSTHIDTGDGHSPSFMIVGRKLSDPVAAPVRFTVDAQGRGLTMLRGDRDQSL